MSARRYIAPIAIISMLIASSVLIAMPSDADAANANFKHEMYIDENTQAGKLVVDTVPVEGTYYDGNGTLTLSGMNFSVQIPQYDIGCCGLETTVPLTIVVEKGTINKITLTCEYGEPVYGIWSDKQLTITGEGELDISVSGYGTYGIGADADITIEKTKVSILSDSRSVTSEGIGTSWDHKGNVTIRDCQLDITCYHHHNLSNCVHCSGDLLITGSDVNMRISSTIASGAGNGACLNAADTVTIRDSDCSLVSFESNGESIAGLNENISISDVYGVYKSKIDRTPVPQSAYADQKKMFILNYQYIKFDLDGGTGTFDKIKCDPDSDSRLPTSVPEKEGYSFAGWSDGSTVYHPGEKIHVAEKDIDLTALWSDARLPELTITSPADESTAHSDTVTVTGTTDADRITIRVNDGPAMTVDAVGGTFSAKVKLTDHENMIEVTAINDNGTTERNIVVYYGSDAGSGSSEVPIAFAIVMIGVIAALVGLAVWKRE